MSEPETTKFECLVMRIQHLQSFAEWMTQAGLELNEFELVEDVRPDGSHVWHFRPNPDAPFKEPPPSAGFN